MTTEARDALARVQHDRWGPAFCISDLGEHDFDGCTHQQTWRDFADHDLADLRERGMTVAPVESAELAADKKADAYGRGYNDALDAKKDALAEALDRYGRHTVGCDAVAPDMAPWETTTCTCGSLCDVHELSCEKAISFNRHEPKWSRRKPKPCTCGLTAALAKWEASRAK